MSSLDKFKHNLAFSDLDVDRNFADSYDPNFFKALKAMQMGIQYMMFKNDMNLAETEQIRASTELQRLKSK